MKVISTAILAVTHLTQDDALIIRSAVQLLRDFVIPEKGELLLEHRLFVDIDIVQDLLNRME